MEKCKPGKTAKNARFALDFVIEREQLSLFPKDQYPIESQNVGAMPNLLIRSALFCVADRSRKTVMVEDKTIFSQGNNNITYTGAELGQKDADVWLVLKKEYLKANEDPCILKTKDILKTLGRSYGDTDKKWLKKKISRLRHSAITVNFNNGSQGIIFNLIQDLVWIDDFNTFQVRLDHRASPLFQDNQYTLIELPVRLKIKKELTKWLYTYITSHQTIYPTYDSKYKELSGCTIKNANDFRKKLKESLKELLNLGVISFFEVARNGLVTIVKSDRQLAKMITKTVH